MICEYYNRFAKEAMAEVDPVSAYAKIEQFRQLARKEMILTDKEHVLYAITVYGQDGSPEKILLFRNAAMSEEELEYLVVRYSGALIYAFHRDTHKKACMELLRRSVQREIRPITLREANTYVETYHRHHKGTTGCKFAIGLYEGESLIGVAICGRPVSRYLDNGEVCEINRVCTRGGENACSMLYGACARIAKEMGYKKIITYILQSESGVSLRASNFVCEGMAGGTHWTGERNHGQALPQERKTRWGRTLR